MNRQFELHLGDCIDALRAMPENSVDSIVTDPPYGIRFMGKAWDGEDIDNRAQRRREYESADPRTGPNGGHRSLAAEAGKYNLAPEGMLAFQQFSEEWAREAFRVLKPGGHLLSFSSPRTYHRMTSGIEDAGFEIRDQIMWVFGSGFPKSHNLKGDWEGWGTALKPAHEPIVVARKPFKGTVAANVLEYGTGAVNIDACRVEAEPMPANTGRGGLPRRTENERRPPSEPTQPHALGRWPANLIHDGSDEVLAAFPHTKSGVMKGGTKRSAQDEPGSVCYGTYGGFAAASDTIGDAGNAARFFYCAKASRKDRNEGMPDPGAQFKHGATLRQIENAERKGNFHPTVKPTDLMAYLCRLVTPSGGVVLDPFMGSGSTGKAAMREGFRFIGCEMSAEYMAIAEARIAHELSRREPSEPYQHQLIAAE